MTSPEQIEVMKLRRWNLRRRWVGGGESLEVLLMQSNGQSATTEELTALECRDNPTVSGYFCQMITHTFQEYMLHLFTMRAAASTFT